MSQPLAIDGIVSGINTSALIRSIIEASARPQRAMQNSQTALRTQRERIATLSTRLRSVSSSIDSALNGAGVNRAAVTSGPSTQFTAQVGLGAVNGNYQVQVDSLARAQVSASQGFADRDALGTIGEGVLTFTVGSGTRSVTVNGTNNSLSGLASAINELEGLSAYVTNTGDASAPWRLVVQSTESGVDGAFTVDDSGLAGGFDLTTTTTAANAQLRVNGLDITRSSNTIEGAIPGLTLNLTAAGGGPETLTIARDDKAFIDRVAEIFSAYNDARTFFNEQSFFNAETRARGPLAGDTTARRAFERLGTLVSGSYTAEGTDLSGLAQLGVRTERNGTLTFDREAFAARLAADPEGVRSLLGSNTGPLAAIRREINEVQVDPTSGSLTTRSAGLEESVRDYETRIQRFQSYLDGYADRLRAQFGAMEAALGRLQAAQVSMGALFAQPAGR
jgi:flagellar hook-associated protein 2